MSRSQDREMDEFGDNPNRFEMDAPASRVNGGDSYDEDPADKLELGHSDGKNPFARLREEDIYGGN